MTSDDLIVRSMHDLGLATRFGGGRMGAVVLDGAADDVTEPSDRQTHADGGAVPSDRTPDDLVNRSRRRLTS